MTAVMNGVADVLEPFGVGQLLEGTPYRLTRALARGASAFVYRAEHTKLGSPVIVKIMAATVDAAPELAGRMRQEAQALLQRLQQEAGGLEGRLAALRQIQKSVDENGKIHDWLEEIQRFKNAR